MNLLKYTLVLVFGIIFSGCSTTVDHTKAPSFFLKENQEFKKAKVGGEYFKSDGKHLHEYGNLVVGFITTHFQKGNESSLIDPEELITLKSYINDSLKTIMADSMPIQKQVDDNSLIVNIIITDLVPGNPALYIGSQAPGVRFVSTAKKLTTGSGIGVGQAAIEVEFVDGNTQEQIAVYRDSKVGANLRVDQGITEWGHIKASFKSWANRLRDQINNKL